MLKGILLKGYSGFYYVQAEDTIWECSLRGKFRKTNQTFLPGDRVKISVVAPQKGVIEEVLPRTNELIRPSVANVDQVVIVFALKNPDPNFSLLDRLLIWAHHEKIPPVIIFNKADLDLTDSIDALVLPYKMAGYAVTVTSTITGEGLEAVRDRLASKVSVFAGPSGAGKSSLLNLVQPGLELQTGEVSAKIGRGKHTTRRVELLKLNIGGMVADTPGFSTLYLPPIKREQLDQYFPEIAGKADLCRFNECLHHQEPDCAVKTAVASGDIDAQRHARYVNLLQEVIENERRY